MREKRSPGSVQGAPGNRRPYCDAEFFVELYVLRHEKHMRNIAGILTGAAALLGVLFAYRSYDEASVINRRADSIVS